MDTIRQDIRYALRMLWKHRFATFVCAGALALGMGANTAIFSMAEAFLLHPVPLDEVNRLVAVVDSKPRQNIEKTAVAPATYLEWQEQSRSFDRLGAYSWDGVNFTGDGTPQKIQDFLVTANFFSTLGVQPHLGRDFLPEEGEPGKNQELILSYGLWERRYASDPKILGKVVKVDGKPFTIVGVMGKGFDFPMSAEAWLPMAFDAKQRVERDRSSVMGNWPPEARGFLRASQGRDSSPSRSTRRQRIPTRTKIGSFASCRSVNSPPAISRASTLCCCLAPLVSCC